MVKECFLRAWKATKFKGVEFQWVCIRDLVVADLRLLVVWICVTVLVTTGVGMLVDGG